MSSNIDTSPSHKVPPSSHKVSHRSQARTRAMPLKRLRRMPSQQLRRMSFHPSVDCKAAHLHAVGSTTNAVTTFCKKFNLEEKVVLQYLENQGLDLDYKKVQACGYKGRADVIYEKDADVCPCCRTYTSWRYNEHSQCNECKRGDFQCYTCATGNECTEDPSAGPYMYRSS